jgi:hypothetical protein
MKRCPSQVEISKSLPFFSRENLLLTNLDTNASFSFEPFTNESRSPHQITGSNVMKIANIIMDFSPYVEPNSLDSSRLIGYGMESCRYYVSETFALKTVVNPPIQYINSKPTRRHQVKHEF